MISIFLFIHLLIHCFLLLFFLLQAFSSSRLDIINLNSLYKTFHLFYLWRLVYLTFTCLFNCRSISFLPYRTVISVFFFIYTSFLPLSCFLSHKTKIHQHSIKTKLNLHKQTLTYGPFPPLCLRGLLYFALLHQFTSRSLSLQIYVHGSSWPDSRKYLQQNFKHPSHFYPFVF